MFYIASEYQVLVDEKSLYSSTLQKLPAPKFIVFFNGSGRLADFLRKNRAEVIKVSIFEYDKEKEEKKLRKAEYEAGWKDGQSEGLNIGLSKGIITMGKRFGLSEEAIINELQETLSCDKKTAIKYIRMENDD